MTDQQHEDEAQVWNFPDIQSNGVDMLIAAQTTPISISAFTESFQQADIINEDKRQDASDAGYQQGFEEGKEQGLAAAQAQCDEQYQPILQQKIQQAERLLDCLQKPIGLLEDQVLAQLLLLTTQLVKHLVCQQIEQNPDILKPIIDKCITVLPVQDQTLEICVSAKCAELIQQSCAQVYHDKVVVDSTLQHGDIVIKSAQTQINAKLEERIKQLLCATTPGNADE